MAHRIGDLVRMRPGSELDGLLGKAAPLTGTVGETWTDERGDRISVVYEDAQLYAFGLSAAEFVPADDASDKSPH